jgi:hypothetical protein
LAEHIYEKQDLIMRLEGARAKKLGEIDNKGIFEHVKQFKKQKGIAGTIVEQCILGYDPDSDQAPDLIVVDGDIKTKTELKTTGMVIETRPSIHYVAKEPMSITAVGVYDIAEQEFYTSHFWEKLEHLLIVYYHYAAKHAVSAGEYEKFPVVGYEFHEFTEDDIRVLKNDWEHVRNLCKSVTDGFPGDKNANWKAQVKQRYIEVHGQLRSVLSFIDLAPKFPPRFRLKKPTVSAIIANHFGNSLEQLPGRYTAVSDIDAKCHELTARYKGRTIESMAQEFGIPYSREKENKAITEQIAVAMFGGTSKQLNQIELFVKFGLIAKSITFTPSGASTEDKKLFRADFAEIVQEYIEEDGVTREFTFEDSELYAYFADHALLCIMFQETKSGEKLGENKFLGFKRLVFSDQFIDKVVKPVWEDTRGKIMNKTLKDVIEYKKNGEPIINKSGSIKSAPNFIKSEVSDIFFRGSGPDSSLKHKTECVNGIKMLPQYIWMKRSAVIDELKKTPML